MGIHLSFRFDAITSIAVFETDPKFSQLLANICWQILNFVDSGFNISAVPATPVPCPSPPSSLPLSRWFARRPRSPLALLLNHIIKPTQPQPTASSLALPPPPLPARGKSSPHEDHKRQAPVDSRIMVRLPVDSHVRFKYTALCLRAACQALLPMQRQQKPSNSQNRL